MGQWKLLGESSAHLLGSELGFQLAEYPSCIALGVRGERERGGCVCVCVSVVLVDVLLSLCLCCPA